MFRQAVPHLIILLALLAISPSIVSAEVGPSQLSSDYVHIDHVSSPTSAIPQQRVTVIVGVSYSFSQRAEIGISIVSTGGSQPSDLMARSREGVVYPSTNTATGSRQYYIAVVMPQMVGLIQLTVHAFYSYGSGWIAASSSDFAINVSASSGDNSPSNDFVGSVTYPAASSPTSFEADGSVSVLVSGNSITIDLSSPIPTSEAVTKGVNYLIGIDSADQGGSVQNPVAGYEIRITTGTPNAYLETGDASKIIKSLQLTVQPNSYVVTGLQISDVGRSFNLHVLGYQQIQTTPTEACSSGGYGGASMDGFYEYFGGGGGYSGPAVPYCMTEPGNAYDVRVVDIPQGGWAPVSLPVKLFLSTPSTITIDGVAATQTTLVPTGVHTISAPSIVNVTENERLRFDHWSDGSTLATRTIDLEDDTNLTSIYLTQYELTLTDPTATGSGWYNQGSVAEISMPSTESCQGIFASLGCARNFQGWYENGNLTVSTNNASITMTTAQTLDTQWTTNMTEPIAIMIATIIGVLAIAVLFFVHRKSTTHKPKQATLSQFVKVPSSCIKCGAELPPASTFCNKCGTKQS